MNITVKTLTDEALERFDYQDTYVIEVDGKQVFKVCDGEIEDNNLGRNFSDTFKIPELMKMAYEAGKSGDESFTVNDVRAAEL